MAWALTQQVVMDPPARFVLVCLANYAGENGQGAFPSADTLSKHTGLALRTVRLKLAQLEEAGVIEKGNQAIAAAYIARADRRPVVYNLVNIRGASCAPRPATGCSSQPNGVQLTTERGAAGAPDTRALILKGSKAPAVKLADALPALPVWLNDEKGAKAWDDFLDNRKKQRAVPTAHAVDLIYKTLDELRGQGNDPVAVLERSTKNGWRDVFALKSEKGFTDRNQPQGRVTPVAKTSDEIAAKYGTSKVDRGDPAVAQKHIAELAKKLRVTVNAE